MGNKVRHQKCEMWLKCPRKNKNIMTARKMWHAALPKHSAAQASARRYETCRRSLKVPGHHVAPTMGLFASSILLLLKSTWILFFFFYLSASFQKPLERLVKRAGITPHPRFKADLCVFVYTCPHGFV